MLYILFFSLFAVCQSELIYSASSTHHNAIINFEDNSCIVSNGEVYVNGVHKGNLSDSQIADLEKYMKETSEWSIKMHKGIYEQVETSIRNFMSRQREFWSSYFTPSTESKEVKVPSLRPEDLSKDVAIPDGVEAISGPKPPAFCAP